MSGRWRQYDIKYLEINTASKRQANCRQIKNPPALPTPRDCANQPPESTCKRLIMFMIITYFNQPFYTYVFTRGYFSKRLYHFNPRAHEGRDQAAVRVGMYQYLKSSLICSGRFSNLSTFVTI